MALYTVLIVDDEPKLRALLGRIIGLEGFEVAEAADCKTALKKLGQSEADIVLCDVKLPDGNGVELTKNIKELYPATEVILLTAYGNITDGVQAIKNGAFDYLTKGDDNNRIIPLLYKAAEKVGLNKRLRHLENQLGNRYGFSSITGSSKPCSRPWLLRKKWPLPTLPYCLPAKPEPAKKYLHRLYMRQAPESAKVL